MKTKLDRGLYPIYLKDIKRKIGYCETWGYGNKDTCKYVAETIIEELKMNNPNLPIRDDLYSDLISITHDINNGGYINGKELQLPLN